MPTYRNGSAASIGDLVYGPTSDGFAVAGYVQRVDEESEILHVAAIQVARVNHWGVALSFSDRGGGPPLVCLASVLTCVASDFTLISRLGQPFRISTE